MSSRPRTARRRWLLVGVAVLLAVALELAIRAGEPPEVGPSGVDMLQVPWVDPDPDAFVTDVDHPWLAVELGTGFRLDGTSVLVHPGLFEVGGVETTVVEVDGVVRYLAQDTDGNVWLLGEQGHAPDSGLPDWSIADGSPAGLVLPAVPRRGDGWATVVPGGEVRLVTRVEEKLTGQPGDRDDELVLVLRAVAPDASAQPSAQPSSQPGAETEVRLARGLGVVGAVAPDGRVLTRQG